MTTRTWGWRCLTSVALVAFLSGGLRAQAPAAVVNGETIPLAEVDAILKARPLRFVKLTEADQREMRQEALDMLIDDRLLQQFLRKNAPAVPPADVDKKLHELQAALKTQGQTLADYLRETGLTDGQLRAQCLTLLQRNAYLDHHLSEAAVRKYYDDHRDFFDQVTVRARHVLLRLPATATTTERDAARARLRSIRQDILAGKITFADAARRYSQCPSASGSGDIGSFLRKGTVEESFACAAFALKGDEISDVVQTSYGLHLIQVIERKAAPPSDFKKIEPKVREIAGEEMLRDLVAQQRRAAQIDVKLGGH